MNGRRLEAELNERGLMFPHYPASAEWATVGGYVAARGSGVLSTRYGKIEDLVLSLRVVSPTGELMDTIEFPRHSVGPDLTQLLIGSEGTLGVVTRATIQLERQPEARLFSAVRFESLRDGVSAFRDVLQAGYRPSVIRLYDEQATRDLAGARRRRRPRRRLRAARLRGLGRGRRDDAGRDARARRDARRDASSPARSRRRGGSAATTSTTRLTTRSCPRSGARSSSSSATTACIEAYDALRAVGRRRTRSAASC